MTVKPKKITRIDSGTPKVKNNQKRHMQEFLKRKIRKDQSKNEES
jgi:hypothetical protein